MAGWLINHQSTLSASPIGYHQQLAAKRHTIVWLQFWQWHAISTPPAKLIACWFPKISIQHLTSLDRKFHPHLPVVMVKKPSYARRAKKVGSCQLTQGPKVNLMKNSKVPDPNLLVCPIKPGSLTSIGKVWHVPGILFACAFYGKCWRMHIVRQSCCLPLAV